MDFLLAGFGWCRMPEHLVKEHLDAGRLVRLTLDDDTRGNADPLAIYAAHLADRVPGPAGRWLLSDLQARLAD
ncbi:LysR substrate-binding domain-containing protein [Henriciella sp. AS95]|uniref:LysR substrate-binding domain-containing protein n=1 Tax=Henriciella sp. AS95 TaxID=3135782 RepID=UPI003177AE17